MPRKLDLSGQRFSKLVALSTTGLKDHGTAIWRCVCDCGCYANVSTRNLRSGHTRSCGCLKGGLVQHGETVTKEFSAEYIVWQSMRHRVVWKNNSKDHERYQGRGISCCERWNSYENFLSDMGRRPSPKHSLDRIDNNGDYEPGNCRWATKKQQARNRRTNRVIEYNGIILCVAEWSEKLGLAQATINQRLTLGWSAERALTATVRRSKESA